MTKKCDIRGCEEKATAYPKTLALCNKHFVNLYGNVDCEARFSTKTKRFVKTLIFALFIYFLFFIVLITVAHHTIGIELYLVFYFLAVSSVVFAVVSYLYVRETGFTKRVKPLYGFVIVSIVLMMSASVVGIVRFGVFHNEPFEVGVCYGYSEGTPIDEIKAELDDIRSKGFTLIRLRAYTHDTWNETSFVMKYAKQIGLKIYVLVGWKDMSFWNTHRVCSDLENYVDKFADYIDYYQLMNEIDVLTPTGSAPRGRWFLSSELINMMKALRKTIEKHDDDAVFLTTFTLIYPQRLDIITDFHKIAGVVDMVGISVYQDQGKLLVPYLLNAPIVGLRGLSGKEVIFSELGSPELDQDAKFRFINDGIKSAKKNGVPIVIIYEWNNPLYGIEESDWRVPV